MSAQEHLETESSLTSNYMDLSLQLSNLLSVLQAY